MVSSLAVAPSSAHLHSFSPLDVPTGVDCSAKHQSFGHFSAGWSPARRRIQPGRTRRASEARKGLRLVSFSWTGSSAWHTCPWWFQLYGARTAKANPVSRGGGHVTARGGDADKDGGTSEDKSRRSSANGFGVGKMEEEFQEHDLSVEPVWEDKMTTSMIDPMTGERMPLQGDRRPVNPLGRRDDGFRNAPSMERLPDRKAPRAKSLLSPTEAATSTKTRGSARMASGDGAAARGEAKRPARRKKSKEGSLNGSDAAGQAEVGMSSGSAGLSPAEINGEVRGDVIGGTGYSSANEVEDSKLANWQPTRGYQFTEEEEEEVERRAKSREGTWKPRRGRASKIEAMQVEQEQEKNADDGAGEGKVTHSQARGNEGGHMPSPRKWLKEKVRENGDGNLGVPFVSEEALQAKKAAGPEPRGNEDLWWNFQKKPPIEQRWSAWQKRSGDVDTAMAAAAAEMGQIELHGETPTVAEATLHRARRQALYRERLQMEEELKEEMGTLAYYKQWVKAWKKDVSKEAVARRVAEGVSVAEQLIEMLSVQTEWEYRQMSSTDIRIKRDPLVMRMKEKHVKAVWGGDPVYPTINYLQDPYATIDYTSPNFHKPVESMVDFLRSIGRLITREEITAMEARQAAEELEWNEEDDMDTAIDIGEGVLDEEEDQQDGTRAVAEQEDDEDGGLQTIDVDAHVVE